MLGSLQVGVVVLDAQQVVLFANETARALLAPPLPTPLPTIWGAAWDAIDEDGAPCPPDELPAARAIATGRPVRNVVLGVARPGAPERVWLLASAEPQRAADGSVAQVICTFWDFMAWQRAADQHCRHEQEFQALVENTPDIIARFDRAMRFVYANPVVEQAAGVAPHDLIGKTPQELGAQEPAAALWQSHLAAVFGSGQARTVELEVPTPHGLRHYQSRLVPERAPDGSTAFILTISRDITERKQAEGDLRASEQRFRAVFDNALEAMMLFDNNDEYVDVNPAACALLGVPRADLMPRRFSSFVVPGMEGVFQQALSAFLAQGQLRGEFPIRREDGAIRELEFIATANCLPGQHLAIMRDITERKQAEQALRRSEERFSKAFRANPTGIMIMRGADGLILDANASWLQIAGYSREEVVGQTVAALNLWADPAEAERVSRLLDSQGHVWEHEIGFRQKSGEARMGSLSVESIELGGEPCLLIMGRDITERKQMEERIRAVERLGALGRVAAGVAHEFNNALAGIMGRLDLLSLEIHEPEAIATLRLIQQAVEDSAAMVQRVQNFGRLRHRGDLVTIPVSELVNDVVTLTQARWRTPPDRQCPGITLQTQVDQGLAVQGNPTELREVLTNLIFNAVDALPQGGQIYIIAEARGAEIVIRVRDTGTGIDPVLAERVFEPFFTTKMGGSGLGLPVVKDIIQSHGGTISLISMPGGGTTFTITLPAAPAAAPVGPPTAPPAAGKRGAARILAVDDDPRLSEMLRAMLAVSGHQVVIAGNGVEALALLDQQPFDLVCTDLGMPGMNGWEVAREVRRRAPGTPVVLVTGWDVQLDSDELAANTVDAVLAKPYRLAQVESLIAQVLARRIGNL